ncbi:MAG: pyruvate kinase, partial [Bacteroidales bacterium]|nr:pyruvate kinase [Bacteroidales bacterium]
LCVIPGPKIRIGKVAHEPLLLKEGDKITLTLDDVPGENNIISLPHPEFVQDITSGMVLLLDDGNLEFLVKETASRSLHCVVVIGGELKSRKGVSAPNAKLTLSAITKKDKGDIEFALKMDTDYIAMSFVRSADDIQQLRWMMKFFGGDAAVIAKIEMAEAAKKYKKSDAETKQIVLLTDETSLNAGAAVYAKSCAACHGPKGKGGIGVNLTDNKWIYGNSPENVFKTIKNGTTKGMASFSSLPDKKLIQVTSFILLKLQPQKATDTESNTNSDN